jgi:hypothetical protein
MDDWNGVGHGSLLIKMYTISGILQFHDLRVSFLTFSMGLGTALLYIAVVDASVIP